MRALTSSFLQPCLLGLLLLGMAGAASGTIIDYNTTIDDYHYVLAVIRGSNPNPPTIVHVVDGATIGNRFGGHLATFDDSIVYIEGGTIDDSLNIHDDSIVHMSGGSVGANPTFVNDYGTLNVSGGRVGEQLHVNDFATVNFSGGYVGADVYARDSSTVDVSGGEIGFGLVGNGSSKVTLRGGIMRSVGAGDSSEVDVFGGSFQGLGAYDSSIVNIYGYDLLLTEVPGQEHDFTLTGTLADGNLVGVGIYWGDNAQIVLHEVPEPGGLVLLLTALGGLWFYRKRPLA